MQSNRVFTVLLVLAVIAVLGLARETKPVPLISISEADFPRQFTAASPQGIDLSPDNKNVGVVFEVWESTNTKGIWVGIWELSTKKLVKHGRIDGPFRHDELSNPQFVRSVRFASDKILVVQTGPRVCVVDATTLARRFFVEPSRIVPPPPYGEVLRSFDISADGKRLAVLTGGTYDRDNEARVAVKVVDVSDGRVLAEWAVHGHSRHVSLPPDGSRIVLDRTGSAGEFSLFEALSGKTLRKVNPGFHPSFGAGNVAFIDNTTIAALPDIGTDANGRFFGNGLRVFDADTGGLTKEISCGKFGSTASLAASTAKPFVATVNAYQTPFEVRSDGWFRHSKPKLVLFDVEQGVCQTVIAKIPHGQFKSTLDQYSLRLSRDASLVALFEEEVAHVYRVLPLKTAKK